ncbi:MAG: helix-turn-helix domain-containing protein [Alphaproteobacteria bacterium]|nr:helix-turn-helix domain-containing protein [Alphaproteobacteria bacterium]
MPTMTKDRILPSNKNSAAIVNNSVNNSIPTAVDSYIGQRIQLRRNMLGITQKVLADKCGITFQQMQKYEKAGNRVSASRLFQIGIALDAPVAFFFSGLPHQHARHPNISQTDTGGKTKIHKVAEPSPNDPLGNNESLQLVNLYWKLPTDDKRRMILDLMKSLAATTPTPMDKPE